MLKNLIDRISEPWFKISKYWRIQCKSAIIQARQRLGGRVISNLFGVGKSRDETLRIICF